MVNSSKTADSPALVHQKRPRWLEFLVPAVPIVLFVIIAIVGPLIIHYDASTVRLSDRFLAPGEVATDGSRAWLGTDDLGRDLLAQIILGAQVSFIVGIFTVAIALTVGVTLGILAGYRGGWLDSVLMRLADIQLSMPPILFAILLAASLGPGLVNVVIALASTRWVIYARVIRGEILSLKERDFVASAKVLGASGWRLVMKHMLPSAMTPLAVVATVQFGLAIVAEASLSFLGIGTPADMPSWGATIANGRDFLATAWWIATLPGVALALVVVSAGRLGDRLRDYYDPHRRTLVE
jgi:peptide/nickel transport system permease protein